MPTQIEIQKIKNLAKNGQSVNQIKEQLELPKSTVYYHFRKEVGQKQKENQLKIPDDPEFKGELCGIFAGDGSYHYYPEKYKHDIRISLNFKDNYWEELKTFLTENLGKEPFLIKEKDKNNITLKYTSQSLYQFLKAHLNWGEDKTLTISLENGHDFDDSFYKGFLRGLIDTDGYKRRDHKRFVFATIVGNFEKTFPHVSLNTI